MSNTTTVLTIDLPGDLGDRLRRALGERPGSTVRDLVVEALEQWLDQRGIRGYADATHELLANRGPLAE